jgi:predicted deacylase
MTSAAAMLDRDLSSFLAPCAEVAKGGDVRLETIGEFAADGATWPLPVVRFAGPGTGSDPVRLGLFAGIHGDEPAGCLALRELVLELVREPARALGYELSIYPIVNPTGWARGTRANHAGRDLNREFWRESSESEVRLLEAELRGRRFDGLITLHADDTCEGHYGYSHGQALDDALLRPALLAAEAIMPRDRRAVIDGFVAREGVIEDCFRGILSPPAEQRPRPFNLIFETPAHAPMPLQVAANVAAIEAILASYRGLISYAQNI